MLTIKNSLLMAMLASGLLFGATTAFAGCGCGCNGQPENCHCVECDCK